MPAVQETVERVKRIDVDQYRYGFETLIESDKAPKGLSEDTVRFISAKKNEPAWMLEWRLDAYRRWLTMTEPTWARVNYPKIDYQDLHYYAAPKRSALTSLDEVDPEILRVYEKLGIPIEEQKMLAGVEGSRDERVAETVRADPLGDPGLAGQALHGPTLHEPACSGSRVNTRSPSERPDSITTWVRERGPTLTGAFCQPPVVLRNTTGPSGRGNTADSGICTLGSFLRLVRTIPSSG